MATSPSQLPGPTRKKRRVATANSKTPWGIGKTEQDRQAALWNADSLGRVRVMPHPSRLCTEVAKRPDIIMWADGRASFHIVPEFVRDEWGIDLEQSG